MLAVVLASWFGGMALLVWGASRRVVRATDALATTADEMRTVAAAQVELQTALERSRDRRTAVHDSVSPQDDR